MLTRRDLLRAGATTGLGLVVSRWLEASALADDAAPKGRAKSVILLYMNGGLGAFGCGSPRSRQRAGPPSRP